MNNEMQSGKKYSFIQSYTLIAQTPLIHFQHSQEGATLRATEVKPKLDAFLINKAKQSGVNVKKWMHGDTDALNYKIRFTASEQSKYTPGIKQYKFYFGNMSNNADTEAKDFVFKNVRMDIVCVFEDLRKLIDENIKDFFVLHNFGTRQSKGFGGFLIKDTTQAEIEKALLSSGAQVFGFYASGTDNELFKHAQAVYSVMKGGINSARFTPYSGDSFDPKNGRYLKPGAYIKGYAQRAFLPDKTGSDKAFVKAKVLRPRRTISPAEKSNPKLHHRFPDYTNDNGYENYVFIRALLGLADHFEYRDDIHCGLKMTKYNPQGQPYAVYHETKVHVYQFDNTTVDSQGRCIVPAKDIKENTGIKRFKSPVTVKIFCSGCKQTGVAFIFDDSYTEILGKTFLLLTNEQKDALKAVTECDARNINYDEASRILSTCAHIKTPESFDKTAFVKGFIKYFNAERSKLTSCGFPQSANIELKHMEV